MLAAAPVAASALGRRTDIYRAILGQTTPGARWHIDEAMKANQAALGPELVVNGGFDSGLSSWLQSAPGAWSVVNGRAYLPLNGAYQELRQELVAIPAGRPVILSLEAAVTAGSSQWFYRNAALVVTVVALLPGSQQVTRLITDGISSIAFSRTGDGGEVSIDNISVREIDLSRCMIFQDAAGTVPVWAPEQPIGLVLDCRYAPGSGLGLPLTQSNTMARPAISARVNLLVATEDFTNGAWSRGGGASTPSSNTLLLPSLGAIITRALTVDASVGRRVEYSIELSGVVGSTVSIGVARLGSGPYEETRFRVTLTDTLTRYTVSHSIVNSGHIGVTLFISRASATADTATSVTAGKADLRLSVNAPPALPVYQRVTTASDYDTAGFPWKAVFNGTNQWMQHAALDMTSTDEVTLWAAATHEGGDSFCRMYELSTNAEIQNGATLFGRMATAENRWVFNSRGTSNAFAIAPVGSTPTPTRNALIGRSKISTDTSIMSAAGVQVASTGADQGTGNYGNHPGFIGSRNGTTLFFKGEIYELGIAGKVITDGQLASLNARMTRSAKI